MIRWSEDTICVLKMFRFIVSVTVTGLYIIIYYNNNKTFLIKMKEDVGTSKPDVKDVISTGV